MPFNSDGKPAHCTVFIFCLNTRWRKCILRCIPYQCVVAWRQGRERKLAILVAHGYTDGFRILRWLATELKGESEVVEGTRRGEGGGGGEAAKKRGSTITITDIAGFRTALFSGGGENDACGATLPPRGAWGYAPPNVFFFKIYMP